MKNKKIKFVIIFIISITIIVSFWTGQLGKKDNSIPQDKIKVSAETIMAVNYNWPIFYAAIGKYPKQLDTQDKNISGLIVPHHDLAADYTAELFQKIGNRHIKTVIIVGPNHENSGVGEIITGEVTYSMPTGQVRSAAEIIKQLVVDKKASLDTNRLQTEHSIYNVIPYVDYYLPDAKIVSIILSGRVTKEQAESLGQYLANYLDDQTIIIGSIDFSHYLATPQAQVNDLVTGPALVNHNYQKIYSFNNDYLDSPATAVTVLSATETVGAAKVNIVRNLNQSEATGISSLPSSTSYFTILLNR